MVDTQEFIPAETLAAKWQPPGEGVPEERPGLTPHKLVRGLVESSRPISATSRGGSHTQVLVLEPHRLEAVLAEWVAAAGRDPAQERDRIAAFAQELSERYLLKVGNIRLFTMRLGGKREAVLPRNEMSEIFGRVGYNLHPSFDKAVQDAMEASREIPYFAYGPPEEQFAPYLPDVIADFVAGATDRVGFGDEGGVFLVYDVDSRRELTVYEILTEDPYFERSIENFQILKAFQEHVREEPLDRATTERLRDFFNKPVTVGIRDTLRWLKGSRHPQLNWRQARPIIEDCFRKHGNENFLLPETTLYGPAHIVEPEELRTIRETNRKVARLLTRRVAVRLPLGLTRRMGWSLLQRCVEQVLRYHHDYPSYPIEPFSGWVSTGTLTLAGRFAFYLLSHLAGITYPRRRNVDVEVALYRRGLLEELHRHLEAEEVDAVVSALERELFRYMLEGGIRDEEGRRIAYRQVLTTFYTFQHRADWLPPDEKLLHRVSLEGLAKPENQFLLRDYPELAEKLVVFFTLVLRFYLDTDFIPDLRPDEAAINIFVLGIWGNITENVIVTISETQEGETKIRIKFVDNKDHFKAYRREVDRERPLGLAKHALRLAGPVVEPAMLRAVGQFVEIVYENRHGKLRQDAAGGLENLNRLLELSGEMVRQGVDETSDHLRTFLTDSIDDTTKLVNRLVRKTLAKPARPRKRQGR